MAARRSNGCATAAAPRSSRSSFGQPRPRRRPWYHHRTAQVSRLRKPLLRPSRPGANRRARAPDQSELSRESCFADQRGDCRTLLFAANPPAAAGGRGRRRSTGGRHARTFASPTRPPIDLSLTSGLGRAFYARIAREATPCSAGPPRGSWSRVAIGAARRSCAIDDAIPTPPTPRDRVRSMLLARVGRSWFASRSPPEAASAVAPLRELLDALGCDVR